MSYLVYLNKPTPENVRAVHDKFGATQPQMAQIAGIGLQTYKGWLAPQDSKNHRIPPVPAWNLLMYELETRRLGFDDLQDFFSKILKNNT